LRKLSTGQEGFVRRFFSHHAYFPWPYRAGCEGGTFAHLMQLCFQLIVFIQPYWHCLRHAHSRQPTVVKKKEPKIRRRALAEWQEFKLAYRTGWSLMTQQAR